MDLQRIASVILTILLVVVVEVAALAQKLLHQSQHPQAIPRHQLLLLRVLRPYITRLVQLITMKELNIQTILVKHPPAVRKAM